MSYGINILNDAGQICFSTDYSCFSLEGKYTVNRTVANGEFPSVMTANYCQLVITATSCPLVFVKPNTSTDSVRVISCVDNGNGTWTVKFTAVSIQSGNYGGGSNLTTLTAYVFTKDNVAETGYGINVYDANSNVTFSTKRRTLKPSAKLITNHFAATGSTRTYDQAISSGSIPTNWACSTYSTGYLLLGLDPQAGYGLVMSLGISKASSTTVQIKACVAIGSYSFVSAIDVLGGSYSIFIDTSIYD
jgi:hypothetical protein